MSELWNRMSKLNLEHTTLIIISSRTDLVDDVGGFPLPVPAAVGEIFCRLCVAGGGVVEVLRGGVPLYGLVLGARLRYTLPALLVAVQAAVLE